MSGLAAKASRPLVLSAHQGAFLPWMGYFDKIARADLFCVLDTVPREQGGDFTNRNKIKTPTGPQWLTVPVRNVTGQPYHEVAIAAEHNWRRKHMRAIELNYSKAPFFDRYAPAIREYLVEERFPLLSELNSAMLGWFLYQLDIRTPILYASHHTFTGEKSALVLDMCQKLGATSYLFGAKGRDYADVPAFEAAGIKVHFQDYQHPEYPQLHGAFVPGLSVIDLLMNVGGPAASRYFVRQSVSTGAKVSA